MYRDYIVSLGTLQFPPLLMLNVFVKTVIHFFRELKRTAFIWNYECLYWHIWGILHLLAQWKYSVLWKKKLFKSNHFYCHITTAHVPWWVKFLRACSRQCRNNLHIDSTYLQTYTEYTHIHILSTHSVLFKTYLQLSIHVMYRMYTFYIVHIYTHNSMRKKMQQIIHSVP